MTTVASAGRSALSALLGTPVPPCSICRAIVSRPSASTRAVGGRRLRSLARPAIITPSRLAGAPSRAAIGSGGPSGRGARMSAMLLVTNGGSPVSSAYVTAVSE